MLDSLLELYGYKSSTAPLPNDKCPHVVCVRVCVCVLCVRARSKTRARTLHQTGGRLRRARAHYTKQVDVVVTPRPTIMGPIVKLGYDPTHSASEPCVDPVALSCSTEKWPRQPASRQQRRLCACVQVCCVRAHTV